MRLQQHIDLPDPNIRGDHSLDGDPHIVVDFGAVTLRLTITEARGLATKIMAGADTTEATDHRIKQAGESAP